MHLRKQAGLWLAGIVVCVAGWGFRDSVVASDAAAPSNESSMPASSALVVRLSGDLHAIGQQQPIALNAAMARRAVRDGVLHVASPDGTTYPVRIDRQFTDAT